MINPLADLIPEPPKDPRVNFSWATVEGLSPLHIRWDGEALALPIEPDSIIHVDNLEVGDRVLGLHLAKQTIIIGKDEGVAPYVPPNKTWFIADLASANATGSYSFNVLSTVSTWSVQMSADFGNPLTPSTFWNQGVKIPKTGRYLVTGSILIDAGLNLAYFLKLNSTSPNYDGWDVGGVNNNPGIFNRSSISFSRIRRYTTGQILTPALVVANAGGPYGITPSGTHFALEYLPN